MRDMGMNESAGVLKIPEHCVVNSRVRGNKGRDTGGGGSEMGLA
jgi:hypothetical protein